MAMAVAAVLGLFAAGCSSDDIKPGRKGNVKYVEEGLTTKDVINRIGNPLYQRRGEGVKLGEDEWIYPTGSVFVRRMVVTEVVDREPGAPLPQKQEEFDYTPFDPFPRDREYFDNQWNQGRR